MADDDEIIELARRLIDRHGEHAAARALIEAGDCTEQGDSLSARLWFRVFESVRLMREDTGRRH